MKTRFLLVTAVLLSFSLLFALPAGAQGKKVLSLATVVPQNSTGWKVINAAATEIEQTTQGRVKIQIYPGGVMGNDSAVLKKINNNMLQGGTFTAGGISEVYRDFQIMSLPLLFRSYDEVDYVRPKVEPIIMKGVESKGLVPVALTEVGFAYLMSEKPIATMADMKGKKIWIPENDPISDAAFKTMGVPPTPRPISDVLTGLQTGNINAFANSPVGTVGLQWYTKVKYLTDAPLVYTYGTLAFKKSALDELSESDRNAVKQIIKKHFDNWNKSARQENAKAMETLKKQGIQVLAMSDTEKKAMEDVAKKATQQLITNNLFSQDLVKQIQALLQEYRSKGK